ncbi:hypothetical protein LCGC14_0932870 [marine sediment metagenome]|uniref:Homing endonuclease LAGLIDADG domain-containing protein n=1 Tax=marine sediment metagenome TaxID=412755 RepID=A0A0F9NMJ1_9ZZZZ
MRMTGKCIKCNKRTQGRNDNNFICRNCNQIRKFTRMTELLRNMDPFDFGWLIGLIEGEGCFYKKGSKCKLRDGIYCYPLSGFTLMSTDLDVMKKFANLLNVDLAGPYYKQRQNERKVVWSVQITGNISVAIMKEVREFLGERRNMQIDEALEWQNRGRFKIEN